MLGKSTSARSRWQRHESRVSDVGPDHSFVREYLHLGRAKLNVGMEKLMREQACKPNFVSAFRRVAIIPLVPPLLAGSSDLPESCLSSLTAVRGKAAALRSGPPLLSYLVLLRVGFSLPPMSPPGRCALTLRPLMRPAPFHPYSSSCEKERYIFCGTFRVGDVRPDGSDIPRRPSLLASTLPCGVRTFLSPFHASPDPVGTLGRGSDRPACSRNFHDSLVGGPGSNVSQR